MILYLLGLFSSSTVLLTIYIIMISKKEKAIENNKKSMKSDTDIDNSDFFR